MASTSRSSEEGDMASDGAALRTYATSAYEVVSTHERVDTGTSAASTHRQRRQQREGHQHGGGVISVPSRILSTLQRKFWDSNKVVSNSAVVARDFLAGAYMASKDRAGEVAGATVHKSLQVYKFARDQSTTMELPGPLKPVRDHVLIPSFRGVEKSVEFLLSPRLGEAYQHVKEHGTNLPVVGRTVFLPSVEAAEGMTRFFLVVVQAPLPSAESVANVAEVSMDVGKRGLQVAFQELYFYMDLIDQQWTRTMTRAQWGILGYGPYADLPPERREEVVDRACEKYLSLENPIQRYEFLAHIRWHNEVLHDDLVQTGLLRSRANAIAGVNTQVQVGDATRPSSDSSGGADACPAVACPGDTTTLATAASPSPSPFAGDAWLDVSAVWRRSPTPKKKLKKTRGTRTTVLRPLHQEQQLHHEEEKDDHNDDLSSSSSRTCRFYREGVVTRNVPESRVGWFRRPRGVRTPLATAGESEGGGQWTAFTARECRRLERAFCAQLAASDTRSQGASPMAAAGFPTTEGAKKGADSRDVNSNTIEETNHNVDGEPLPRRSAGIEGGDFGQQGAEGSANGMIAKGARVSSGGDRGGNSSSNGGNDGGEGGFGPSGTGTAASVAYQPASGLVVELYSYEVQPGDVLVEQGRYAVSLSEMTMRPVYWPFLGQGDEVCRAVWMRDTGARPYPRPKKTGRASRRGGDMAVAGEAAESEKKRMDEVREQGNEEEEEEGEGPVGLEPYPLRAAAILEDAYQFLAWHLGCREAGRSSSTSSRDEAEAAKGRAAGSSSPTVLLTVQVADQLVQFRSLTDIVSVKRSLGGAFSILGRRRVFRGIPADHEEDDEGERGMEAGDAGAADPPTPQVNSRHPGASFSLDGRSETGGGGGLRGPDHACGTRTTLGAAAGDDNMSDNVCPMDDAESCGDGLNEEGVRAGETTAPTNPKGSSICGSFQGPRAKKKDKRDKDLEERVEHLVLVVHGIGDALMSADLGVVQLSSLVECCDTMRANHEEVMMNSKHLRGLRNKRVVGGRPTTDGERQKDKGDERARCGSDILGEKDAAKGDGRSHLRRNPSVGSREDSRHQHSVVAEDLHPSSRSGGGGGGGRSDDNRRNRNNSADIGRELPNNLGRVEYLPVEWHTRFKGRLYREGGGGPKGNGDRRGSWRSKRRGAGESSSPNSAPGPGLNRSEGWPGRGRGGGGVRTRAGGDDVRGGGLSIWDITLPRAPTLRAFTNDTLLDILYFMSPEYHQVIVEEVTDEINRVVALFRKHTRDWSGKVSIVAHSLGAIICFDIMANQVAEESLETARGTVPSGDAEVRVPAVSATPVRGREGARVNFVGGGRANAEGDEDACDGGGGGNGDGQGGDEGAERGNVGEQEKDCEGCLRYYRGSTKFPALSVRVENVFCLGSPIGMFLMIRGQHRRLGKSFKLPGCRRLFNIFHPYDPVAFRLEPLLRGAGGSGDGNAGSSNESDEDAPPPSEDPVILPTWTGGLRVHYQVQRWWHEILSRAWETKQRAEASLERSLESIGLIDELAEPDKDSFRSHESLFSPGSSSSSLFPNDDRTRRGEDINTAATLLNGNSPEDTAVPSSVPTFDGTGVDPLEGSSADTIFTADAEAMLSIENVPEMQPHTTFMGEQHRRVDSSFPQPPVTQMTSSMPCPSRTLWSLSEGNNGQIDESGQQQHQRQPYCCSQQYQEEHRQQEQHDRPFSNGRISGLATAAAAAAKRPTGARPGRVTWKSAVMQEDVERNGALAGGRRVDYCLQEKEFEVTNEYIFALGSHVIYWSSKDVSLFVAQQVVDDAIADEQAGATTAMPAPVATASTTTKNTGVV